MIKLAEMKAVKPFSGMRFIAEEGPLGNVRRRHIVDLPTGGREPTVPAQPSNTATTSMP